MYDSYRSCAAHLLPLMLVGLLLWVGIIYGAYRLVSWGLR